VGWVSPGAVLSRMHHLLEPAWRLASIVAWAEPWDYEEEDDGEPESGPLAA
jgi:hypothetical protein